MTDDNEPDLGGRPTDYRPEFVEQARKLCALGATDEEIADFFEVSARTIYRWKNAHDEFCQALKVGKEIADERVERSLYMKAVGYRQDAVKVFMPANSKEPVFAEYQEVMAPDTTACIFWLKNRKAAEWRDKQDHEHNVGGSLTMIERRIVQHSKPEDGE